MAVSQQMRRIALRVIIVRLEPTNPLHVLWEPIYQLLVAKVLGAVCCVLLDNIVMQLGQLHRVVLAVQGIIANSTTMCLNPWN